MVDYRMKAESAMPPQRRWHTMDEPIPEDREVWLYWPATSEKPALMAIASPPLVAHGITLYQRGDHSYSSRDAVYWHEMTKPVPPC